MSKKLVTIKCDGCSHVAEPEKCPHYVIAVTGAELIRPISPIEVTLTCETDKETGKHMHEIDVQPEKAKQLFTVLYNLLVEDYRQFMIKNKIGQMMQFEAAANGKEGTC